MSRANKGARTLQVDRDVLEQNLNMSERSCCIRAVYTAALSTSRIYVKRSICFYFGVNA